MHQLDKVSYQKPLSQLTGVNWSRTCQKVKYIKKKYIFIQFYTGNNYCFSV